MNAPSQPASSQKNGAPSAPSSRGDNEGAMTPYERSLLAILGRIADAIEGANMIALASTDRPAPNLRRPLDAYAGFDWAGIGAEIVAQDRFGATEVQWGERMFKRYRSADDDEKGTDIRFRRVKSGTVAEKNLEWETLIKFADSRPAKPLRGELAERIQEASAHAPAVPSQDGVRGQAAPSQTQKPATGAPSVPASAAPHSPEPAPSQAGTRGQAAPSQPRTALAKGEKSDKVIRAALEAGAAPRDLAAAVHGSNGPQLFWAACRHWFVAKPAVDAILAARTDAQRVTNWGAAIMDLAPHVP